MIETDKFKESYFKGCLIWVKGATGVCKVALTYELLGLCEVESSQALALTASQFVALIEEGIPRGFLTNFRAIVISEFENLSPVDWLKFLKCMQIYRHLRFALDVRMILASSVPLSLERSIEILALKPVIIRWDGESVGRDLDGRIHGLIEKASAETKVPVLRLSERAAVFLESIGEDWQDGELYALLVRGIFRSENSILRFSDLLPPKNLEMIENWTRVTI